LIVAGFEKNPPQSPFAKGEQRVIFETRSTPSFAKEGWGGFPKQQLMNLNN